MKREAVRRHRSSGLRLDTITLYSYGVIKVSDVMRNPELRMIREVELRGNGLLLN